MRQAKARAALRGMKLKEFVAEALENAIYYGQNTHAGQVAADGAEDNDDILILDQGCSLPLIRGSCGPELNQLSGGKAAELLEQEDVDRTANSRRR